MHSSGLPGHWLEYAPVCTAEGDRIILELQTARFLIRAVDRHLAGDNTLPDSVAYLVSAPVLPAEGHALGTAPALQALYAAAARNTVLRAHARLQESSKTMGPDAAWNSCAVDLITAARVHCLYTIVRIFTSEVEALSPGPMKAVLQRVCACFGLCTMQENAGHWLGVVTTSQFDLLRSEVREVLQSLRNDAVALADAFDIPDHVLNSDLVSACA